MSTRYQHGGWCSGSERHPRTPGNSCSCHSCDLSLNNLDLLRHGDQIKRTIRVATCPVCRVRTEFPFTNGCVPREVFCIKCSTWTQVETISWDGKDLAKLLPVFSR